MKTYVTTLAVFLLLATQPLWAKKNKKSVHPDYTKGAALQNTDEYWNIGPTGIVGYFWSRTTTKQIPVKEVQKGSPAEGQIKVGDVLVGLGKGRFTNARDELIAAIIEAENVKGGGEIAFQVWRPTQGKKGDGQFLKVTLKVPFMGAYSETSPWGCPKTERMIEKAVEHILSIGLGEEQLRGQERSPIVDDLFALGLLATGDQKHLPLVRKYAHKVAGPDIIYGRGGRGAGSWGGGYRNIFLTEYYLITKDDHVLPTIKSLSEYIALGVSGVGTWSHGMASKTYGPPGAYGAMNLCGISCSLSLVLAKKCGIESDAINKALNLNIHFLNWFINKGTIPYGDHPANAKNHDSNGRNSHAAVLYDLYGHKKGAEFYTRMTVASYPVRQGGHTGHFFSWVWGSLGAARGGKDAAGSFMKNIRYYTELDRRFDGSCVYQGEAKYTGWDGTGARLMAYCLPRKALYITGKGGSTADPIKGDELNEVVATGNLDVSTLSVEGLLKALGNWSPVARRKAAMELGLREDDVVDKLIAMLDSQDTYSRYGACLGLQYAGRGSEKAVKLLLDKIENAKDPDMRYYAVIALKVGLPRAYKHPLGKVAMTAGPAIVKLAGEIDKNDDPYGKLNQQIVSMLFYKGRVSPHSGYYKMGKGLEKLDSDLVVAAMKAWLTNPNGGARTGSVSAYGAMSKEQLEQLWPQIYMAANEPAPSGVMFASGGKQVSMRLMADHKFKEALPMAVADLVQDGWGAFSRVPASVEVLSRFGSAVKPYMPFVEARVEQFKYRDLGLVKKLDAKYKLLMANLAKDVELKSVKPYLKAAGIPYKKPQVTSILQSQAHKYFGWEVVGKPDPKARTWRYKTLKPKPGKEYATLNIQNGVPFKDVAAGEGLKDWFKPNFDDSSWKTGLAPFGKEPWRDSRFEMTARTQWKSDDPYLLMRTTIQVDELKYEAYRLHIVDTIGVRLYLNGEEIFTPKYYWGKQPKYRVIGGKANDALRKGKNTLAIYANNHGKGAVMVDCYIEGLIKREKFDPTPYYKEQE